MTNFMEKFGAWLLKHPKVTKGIAFVFAGMALWGLEGIGETLGYSKCVNDITDTIEKYKDREEEKSE